MFIKGFHGLTHSAKPCLVVSSRPLKIINKQCIRTLSKDDKALLH